MESENENSEEISRMNVLTQFRITTPLGPVNIDLKSFDDAKAAVQDQKVKKPNRTLFEQTVYDFLGGNSVSDYKYWRGSLGGLMKLYSDTYLSQEWEVVDEFDIDVKDKKCGCTYDTYDNVPNGLSERFLSRGYRLYQNRINPEVGRFVLQFTIDGDGDHNLVLHRSKNEVNNGEEHDMDGPSSIIVQIENDFYINGPLKGAFFDLRYNFIKRDISIEELIAWDEEVKETLWKDVISFQKAMPFLYERGLPNSRGLILAGPPGTGKTMIAKWLAANSTITCILISAEMIAGRHDVKKCYEIARKLSPSLLIIEDIDTVGALDRRVTDHPLLGEFLQSMDGIVPNHGVITLATTNHSNKIDPAIADRPGRFDRIIEVGLPGKEQRFHILRQLLKKFELDSSVNKKFIKNLANMSEGLTGAWLREVVQSSFINIIADERELLTTKSLLISLKDVLKRRGMAFRVAPYGVEGNETTHAYVQ